jgi:cell division protein FtsB
VPAIIPVDVFDRVQRRLKARDPRRTPPGIAGSRNLLTGLLRCAHCGRAMTISTGKSGQYRYYACSGHTTGGSSVCRGQRIPAMMLEKAVIETFAHGIFTAVRLDPLIDTLVDALGRDGNDIQVVRRVAQAELRRIEDGITAHYDLITQVKGAQDHKSMHRKLETLLARRKDLEREIADLGDRVNVSAKLVDARMKAELADMVRRKFIAGNVAYQKAYLQMFIGRIEFDNGTATLVRRESDYASGKSRRASSRRGIDEKKAA